jgi:hypothetical protein
MGAFTNSFRSNLDWIADPFGLNQILIKSNLCLQIRASDFEFLYTTLTHLRFLNIVINSGKFIVKFSVKLAHIKYTIK